MLPLPFFAPCASILQVTYYQHSQLSILVIGLVQRLYQGLRSSRKTRRGKQLLCSTWIILSTKVYCYMEPQEHEFQQWLYQEKYKAKFRDVWFVEDVRPCSLTTIYRVRLVGCALYGTNLLAAPVSVNQCVKSLPYQTKKLDKKLLNVLAANFRISKVSSGSSDSMLVSWTFQRTRSYKILRACVWVWVCESVCDRVVANSIYRELRGH